jgi:hypothetical protein
MIISLIPFGVLQTEFIIAIAEARLIEGCDIVPAIQDRTTTPAE